VRERDVSFSLISRAPLSNIKTYKELRGWTVPWFSSEGSDFNQDFGLTTDEGETFGLNVFLRDEDSVLRTYFTSGRGVETLGTSWPPRCDAVRTAAGMGGLARGVPAKP
jgi:predicted dithiol-disulfide oxidoreductase (DUF899 family)